MHRSSRDSRDADFARFVQLYRTELLRTARLLTAGNRDLAEDLVQTALVRVYVIWPRLRQHPMAYVRRTMVNAYIDETRRPWWRRERPVSELPEPPSEP